MNNIHTFGSIPLQNTGSIVKTSDTHIPSDGHILKIEIDQSISSKITVADVLKALQSYDSTEDSGLIEVNGNTYSCKYTRPKAETFALGTSPENSEDVSSRFIGTVYVSPSATPQSTSAETKSDWQLNSSYEKFHKPIPFGYDNETRSNKG